MFYVPSYYTPDCRGEDEFGVLEGSLMPPWKDGMDGAGGSDGWGWEARIVTDGTDGKHGYSSEVHHALNAYTVLGSSAGVVPGDLKHAAGRWPEVVSCGPALDAWVRR